MSTRTHLELGRSGGHFLARISLGVPRPDNPYLPFVPKMMATPIGDHPIVGIFDTQIRARLHDIFAGTDWSHISVVRIGYPGQRPSECPATILVAVRPNTLGVEKAAGLVHVAAAFVYGFTRLRDIAIEIIEADVVPHSDDTLPDRKHFDEALCATPPIGAGLGLSDSRSTGTLGGYLRISTAKKSKYVALACHQVLSGIERESTCATLALLRIQRQAGTLDQNGRQRLHLSDKRVKDGEEKCEKIARFQNHLGKVYCTSGVGVTDGWISDWGLVELAQERFPSFDNLSTALSSEVVDYLRGHYQDAESLTIHGGIASQKDLVAASSGRLDDSHKNVVFKCGRTTGNTRGVLNSIISSVRMSYGDNVPVVGSALVVLSPSETSPTGPGSPGCGSAPVFGRKGDFGSLVFDYRGKVLGIYVGRQNEGPNREDYKVNPPITPPYFDGIHFVSPIGSTINGIRAAVRDDPTFGGLDVDVEFLWGPSE
ncbi:uncharacterized protein B0H64DRAFT_372705 [Chaetomium fimeti]|uniref:Uncharacterized protein n=1 Tax=Chaetomium fimeti TaxID=1854472 RepID=A0AAE0HKI9_9PEZI|nr:hypothetical protein B0H64DRAFT_372705 [Chaetomium fimeti]